jgi:hypothetical protein
VCSNEEFNCFQPMPALNIPCLNAYSLFYLMLAP